MFAHHTIWRGLIGALFVVTMVLASAARVDAQDMGGPGAEVALIASDENSLTIALTVHDFSIEDVEGSNGTRKQVRIPGTYLSPLPSLPEVPVRGAWLGVPTFEGLALQVLESEDETLAGIVLALAPQVVIETADLSGLDGAWMKEVQASEQSLQTGDALYPPTVAELGTSGYLRDQAVVQLLLHPLQSNQAAGEMLLHRRIVVRISWMTPATGAGTASRRSSAAYEDLLRQTLLNYDSLGRLLPDANASTLELPEDDTLSQEASISPAVKIGVEQDGVYRITYAQLSSAGFNPSSIDPRTIKVFNQGHQIPIFVRGEEDGVFNQADTVLFYGTAIRSLYTTRNVYWLYAGGETGLRMSARNGTPVAGTPLAAHFPTTLHAEEDTVYWQAMPGQSGEDRWFWGTRLSPSTGGMSSYRDYTLSLANISTTATQATVRVRLKGYTGLAHRTRIRLNGQIIDDRAWHGQIPFDHTVTISHALLRNGANTVRVETVDTGASVDQILVNWIEFDYWDRYVAESDELPFRAQATGRQQFLVRGLSTSDVLVLDTTLPSSPARIVNFVVENDGSARKVRFDDAVQPNSHYRVVAASHYRTPATIVLDQPTSWRSPANGADYIVITHDNFYNSAVQLANHRRSQGLRTAVVKISDVYDEFSGGIFTPQAIRDFLHYAYENWAAPAPTYILLIGDATQDYKDNLHDGTVTYVPSMNIESTLFGEVSSDNWFVSVAGSDVLPDMFIGRLVAQSPAEAASMVQNLIRYDQTPPGSAWNTRALLVADDDESIFSALADDLADALPADYTVTKVYAANYPPGNPHTDVVNRINNGAIIVTYVGHGEYNSWGTWNYDQSRIFDISDVAVLNNVDKLPFVVVGDCLNGFFAGPRARPALAEAFQRRDRAGAVANWAATGLGYPSGHEILLKELYGAIFTRYQLPLGVSTTAAKIATYAQSSFWRELVETYVLFGDPATRLGIPVPTQFVHLPLVIHR